MSPPQSSRPFDGTDALIKAFEKLYDSQENHIGQLQASLNILHQNFGILKNSSVKHQLRLESLANSLTNNLKHVAVLSKNCHNTQKLLMRFSARNQATAEPAVTEKSEEASNNYVDDTTPEQASRDRSKPPPIILPNHDKTFQEEESVIDIVPLAQGIPGVMDSNLSCWATEPTISEQKAPEQKVVAEPLNPEITLAKSQSNTTKFTSIDGTMVIKYAKTAEPQPILEPRGLNRSLWAPRTRATVVPVNLPTKEPTSNNFAEKFAAAAAKFSIKIGPVVMSSQQSKRERRLSDS